MRDLAVAQHASRGERRNVRARRRPRWPSCCAGGAPNHARNSSYVPSNRWICTCRCRIQLGDAMLHFTARRQMRWRDVDRRARSRHPRRSLGIRDAVVSRPTRRRSAITATTIGSRRRNAPAIARVHRRARRADRSARGARSGRARRRPIAVTATAAATVSSRRAAAPTCASSTSGRSTRTAEPARRAQLPRRVAHREDAGRRAEPARAARQGALRRRRHDREPVRPGSQPAASHRRSRSGARSRSSTASSRSRSKSSSLVTPKWTVAPEPIRGRTGPRSSRSSTPSCRPRMIPALTRLRDLYRDALLPHGRGDVEGLASLPDARRVLPRRDPVPRRAAARTARAPRARPRRDRAHRQGARGARREGARHEGSRRDDREAAHRSRAVLRDARGHPRRGAGTQLDRAKAAIPRFFSTLPKADCVMRETPAYEAPFSTVAYYRQPHYDGSQARRVLRQHVQARDPRAVRARSADLARVDPGPSPADRDRAGARRAARVPQARRLDRVRRGLGAVHRAARRRDGPLHRAISIGSASCQLRRVARVAARRRYRHPRDGLDARAGGGVHARAHRAHRDQHLERGRSLHRLARPGARVQGRPARDPAAARARRGDARRRSSTSRRSTRSCSARVRSRCRCSTSACRRGSADEAKARARPVAGGGARRRHHDRHGRVSEDLGDGARGRQRGVGARRVDRGGRPVVHRRAHERGARRCWPRAGGEYVFLREGYGPAYGFLYAWNRFWIGAPGSIAAYAVGTTTFFGSRRPARRHDREARAARLDRAAHRAQLRARDRRRRGPDRAHRREGR